MADLVGRLRAYDPKASLIDRLREHDLSSYSEDGDWQDHYCDRADDLLKEAAAALEAEASKGERLREAIREALDCFKAAEAEGMADRVAEARAADGFDPASVAGLFERRVAFAIPALERALIPEAPVRDGWQAIETAPKDGRDVLLLMRSDMGSNQIVASFDDDPAREGWTWQTWDGPNYHTDTFTHWRPLPPPPQDNREG